MRMAAIESRPTASASPFLPYGQPGYDGIPQLSATGSVISELHYTPPLLPSLLAPTPSLPATMAMSTLPWPPSMGIPITHISFHHSPSPVPSLSLIVQAPHPPSSAAMHMPPPLPSCCWSLRPRPCPAIKNSLPTYDGREDPLGWLKRCGRFFRALRTPDSNKVWLTSFHLTGTAQQWYYVVERDTGEPTWEDFKSATSSSGCPFVPITWWTWWGCRSQLTVTTWLAAA